MDKNDELKELAERCSAAVGHPYLQEVRFFMRRTRTRTPRYSLRVSFNTVLTVELTPVYRADDVLAFVKRHRRYIVNRLRETRVIPSYAVGERVFLFGEEYVVAWDARGYYLVGRERIDCGQSVVRALTDRLLAEGERFLTQYTAAVSAACGIKRPAVKVSRGKSYWACCRHEDGGDVVCFRRFACLLPPSLLEYLTVHELCHIKQRNHSPRFWAEVAKYIPQYQACHKALGDYSAVDFNEIFQTKW